jgi:hypothetical protein
LARLLRTVAATALAVGMISAAAIAASASDGSTPAPSSVTKLVTSVPARTLDAVGAGPIKPTAAFGAGKFTLMKLGAPAAGTTPNVLDGALQWCPHCAANSWALAIALSRFGTLSGLRLIDSGTYYGRHLHAKPAFSHTQGLSFYKARYSSTVISFTSVVLQSVTGTNLQQLTAAEKQAIGAFDAAGAFPAVDVAGVYGFVNSGFSPGILHGATAPTIARDLADPTNPIAQHIDGLANVFTAAICAATSGKPTSVCASKGVTAAAARL